MPLGKRTEEVRARVDGETMDMLNKRARDEGLLLGEWLGLKLMIEAHGVDRIASLYATRIARIAGNGKESA